MRSWIIWCSTPHSARATSPGRRMAKHILRTVRYCSSRTLSCWAAQPPRWFCLRCLATAAGSGFTGSAGAGLHFGRLPPWALFTLSLRFGRSAISTACLLFSTRSFFPARPTGYSTRAWMKSSSSCRKLSGQGPAHWSYCSPLSGRTGRRTAVSEEKAGIAIKRTQGAYPASFFRIIAYLAMEATSAAKSSCFFSIPSPFSKRTHLASLISPPSSLATAAICCSTETLFSLTNACCRRQFSS